MRGVLVSFCALGLVCALFVYLRFEFLRFQVWVAAEKCFHTCGPEDEFEDGQTSTEWDDFMEDLIDATFKPNSLPCMNTENQTVTIDANSDIVWDLRQRNPPHLYIQNLSKSAFRYQIYNERKDKAQNTLDDCYCKYSDCKSAEFKQCMTSARVEMKKEVKTVMTDTISTLLFELMLEC